MATLLVVGLGNPGARFERTRHNAGFWVVSRIASLHGTTLRKALFRRYRAARFTGEGGTLALAQPLSYMNRSGKVMPHLMRRFNTGVEQTVIVCDTLDLPPGKLRLKRGGSHAGHRGLASIVSALGESAFMRLYIGVGRPQAKAQVTEYVLGEPDAEEQGLYTEAVSTAAWSCERLLTEPVDAVMNELNRGN